jgi:hypothetical protein
MGMKLGPVDPLLQHCEEPPAVDIGVFNCLRFQ